MPHDPAARRGGRVLTAALSLTLLGTLVAVQPATGQEDLHRRKNRVERALDDARHELDQSSGRLLRAARALEEARRRLDRAKVTFVRAHGQRVAAVLLDERRQAELDVAQRALEQGEAQVAAAQRRIRAEERELRTVVVEAAQSVDSTMMSLSLVLTADEPAALTGRLNAVQNVLARQESVLERLEAARIVLEVKRAQLESARDLVADRRAQAARSLRLRVAAEEQALRAQQQVRALTEQARAAKQEAAKAKAQDLKRLRKLQRERERVQRLLRRHYAAARRREARQRAAARRDPVSAAGRWPWPANGWLSSPYGMRFHPVYRRWSLHDGLDIAANCGRPVRATAAGRVVARYYNSAYGNRVIIGHGLRGGVGLATTYNHLSGFSTFTGQRVRQGDVIGYVGSTGYSTGCHLHFMVLRNGRPVNPRPWLR